MEFVKSIWYVIIVIACHCFGHAQLVTAFLHPRALCCNCDVNGHDYDARS